MTRQSPSSFISKPSLCPRSPSGPRSNSLSTHPVDRCSQAAASLPLSKRSKPASNETSSPNSSASTPRSSRSMTGTSNAPACSGTLCAQTSGEISPQDADCPCIALRLRDLLRLSSTVARHCSGLTLRLLNPVAAPVRKSIWNGFEESSFNGAADVAFLIRISGAEFNPKGAGLGPDLGSLRCRAVRFCLSCCPYFRAIDAHG